ncbi:MerR family transcriptional regulator [Streptomyces monticola]|uniref:MerR family transcriptional regulator n=1 Tax=Streptomyces monticola TaxID=2666263 RepID=A0ABW2JV62_9ACTN
MNDTDALMSIGAFARRVGLAPSALRFYDDCGVLHPAHVDGDTGYRSYSPGQETRAVLVRRLREAGMPLTDACVVLDGSHEEARAVLEQHARKARDTAAAAQSAVEEVLRDLPRGHGPWTAARIGGAELASAVRQVAPAVATGDARQEFPVLGCVLVELDGPELRLVATDRYRLAVRTLRARSPEGAPRSLLVGAEELRDAAAWAMRREELTIEVDEGGTRLRGESDVRMLATVDDTFPDYRLVLEGLPAVRHRIITDRTALRGRLVGAGAAAGGGPVSLRTGGQRLTLVPRDPGDHGNHGNHFDCVDHGDREPDTLPALCTGGPLSISFDPEVLVPALDAGVGPDVLLEISAPTGPVVVRSADQGSFTTLVMPVADDET